MNKEVIMSRGCVFNKRGTHTLQSEQAAHKQGQVIRGSGRKQNTQKNLLLKAQRVEIWGRSGGGGSQLN